MPSKVLFFWCFLFFSPLCLSFSSAFQCCVCVFPLCQDALVLIRRVSTLAGQRNTQGGACWCVCIDLHHFVHVHPDLHSHHRNGRKGWSIIITQQWNPVLSQVEKGIHFLGAHKDPKNGWSTVYKWGFPEMGLPKIDAWFHGKSQSWMMI